MSIGVADKVPKMLPCDPTGVARCSAEKRTWRPNKWQAGVQYRVSAALFLDSETLARAMAMNSAAHMSITIHLKRRRAACIRMASSLVCH